jgi:hypothetical protein
METCNENLLTVKLSPDNVNKEHYRYAFFTINIKDTVLTEIEVQSFPNSSDLFRTDSKIEWRINNHYYKIRYEYKNSSKECYIKEFMQIANATLYNIIPYDFSFKEISFEINDLTAPNRGKKLKNIKDIVLFKTDFPFTPDFWKQYFQ